jgi:prepilin-type processing-associated H-X9-DG protein
MARLTERLEGAALAQAAGAFEHPGGGNFFFMDGSVRFLKTSTALRTFWALCTRNNGEIISSDAY